MWNNEDLGDPVIAYAYIMRQFQKIEKGSSP